uniref:Uncharacterized protein n=1 Tax=Arundo donax TaxID=35708 RepID=A0A0A9E7N9_ARUDO
MSNMSTTSDLISRKNSSTRTGHWALSGEVYTKDIQV